jgi:transposase
MIKSVGIDLAVSGEHKVRCLDERAEACDGFTFQTTSEGFAKLESRIFGDGSNPIIIFEPTGLVWLVMAIYLKARHPDCRLVRVQGRKVVALRKYLHRSSKSDKIDALTLAKMSFIDSDRLEEVYLPPEKIYSMHRLARQRKRLESEITTRKTRIGSIIDGYFPGVRKAFSDPWSAHARAFLSSCLNPITVVQAGEKALHAFLSKERHRGKAAISESHRVFFCCKDAANIYELSKPVGTIGDNFFADLQEEISRELRIMEMMEVESDSIAKRLEELYLELHPSDNLRTIPGVGEHTAHIFLATVGDPARFRSQSAFANYSGVVPAARQSSQSEAKGLRMTKAGPATLKWALYQASQIGRRYDPQLASVYYREMVHHGKNHKQSMGAVMSHLGARVLSVLRKNEPYELRDTQGNPITQEEARRLILSDFQVPEEIRRERRRCKTTDNPVKARRKRREMVTNRVHEAAEAPQPVVATSSPGNQFN